MRTLILFGLMTALSGAAYADSSDNGNLTIGGQALIVGTMTVQGNAFSVGGATLAVTGGSVGIGTATPQQSLEVNGNTFLDGNLFQINNSGTPELYLNKLGTRGWSIRNDGALKVFNWQDSNYYLTILNGGNVGIGTTNPQATLQVNGTASILGAWVTKSTGAVVQAASDGFVVAMVTTTSGDVRATLQGYTDSSNPPTTQRNSAGVANVTAGYNNVLGNSFTMPVRKGDYWKVTTSFSTGGYSGISISVYFIPFGN